MGPKRNGRIWPGPVFQFKLCTEIVAALSPDFYPDRVLLSGSYFSNSCDRPGSKAKIRKSEMDRTPMRVLSIQSHVVSGYVGNKSAVFPLQLLGFEVDAINSVQFSNHTGYGVWTGRVLQKEDLTELMKGLSHNGLDNYSHLLTGYIGDSGFLRTVGEVAKQLRKVNPSLTFVCDPVMGDNGALYVPEDLVPLYRSEIVPLANVITPNHFELELLTERTINNLSDVFEAADLIHEMGVEIVFLTSATICKDSEITAVLSSKKGKERKIFKISVPIIPATFTGSGDLTSALFLAWYAKTKDLQVTLEKLVATIQAILKRTFQVARVRSEGDNLTVAALELKIIDSKADIENPTCTIPAELVNL